MSCNGIRTALADCLLKSDCVLKSEPPLTPHECLQHHSDALPIECQQLRRALFECKRGMLDMRKRFRGVEPASTKVSPVATDERGRPS